MAYKFVYPGSDLDKSRTLISVLGSFWYRTYTASDQVQSYAAATAQSVAQNHRNLLETVAALSRYEVPLYHTEEWTPITLRKSQMNTGDVGVGRFDRDGLTMDDGRSFFDRPIARAYYSFPKPEKFVGAAQLFNKLVFPTVALAENTDFTIDETRGALVLAIDPFDRPDFAKRIIYENNKPVDEEITIWAFQGRFDYQYVFTQFAYALGLYLKTSQGYKDLMNAVVDGLVNGGATAHDIDLAFSAICGVPLVAEDQETVEVLQLDAHGLFIATDKNVYRFPEEATPVVAVGDTLRAGDRLIDALEIIQFTDGTVPERLTALALDRGYMSACYYGDLVFENKSVPLTVKTDHPSGYTFVSFPLSGHPTDVEQFFEDLHARGVAAATVIPDPIQRKKCKFGTLAHILDKRAQPMSEPTTNNLPSTINPLAFLAANILRNNVFVVHIKAAALGRNRLGLYNIRHLHQLLPPHSAMLVIYELGGLRDAVSGADDVIEDTGFFKGAEPLADAVTEDLLRDGGATLRTISGTCQ